MIRKRLFPFLVLTVLILVFPHPRALNAQTHRVMNAAETELALKKLLVLGSVLYIAAHPDDENTALLAYLSNERLVRTAYLSVTRGDGGQNLIGTEQGALLGVIRTQELLAAREIDGAEQFFTRAIDFGYSKSPEETISIWGRDVILADIVWIIRRFRPDVIITRFPKTGEGGHGHHTASAILAEEAFHAASDPSRFPEQLRSVRPWKPKRLFWNNRRPRLENRGPEERKLLSLDLGSYNPLLGKSYTEVAANSRSMHKSQGFGSAERRGSSLNYLEQLAGEPFEKDLFDGVDLSWRRISGGETAGEILEEALRSYRPDNPQLILPLLIRAHAEISKLSSDDPLIAVKRKELLDVIRACAGLWVEAITSSPSATPGSEVRLTATLVNRSDHPFRLESIGLPYGNPAHQANAELKNNQPVTTQLVVKLPADLDWSQPYWLRNASGKGTFNVNDQSLIGLPENPPALPVTLKVSTSQQSLVFETPAVFRWTDRVKGEQFRPFEIVPPVAINLEEKVQVFPDHQAKSVRVVLKSNAESISGMLRLRTPGGWRVTPESVPINLKGKNDELAATFTITPPSGPSAGTLIAEVDAGGHRFSRSVLTINHPHLPMQTLFPPAEARLVRLDLQKKGDRVGYIMGSGDEIPESLRQVGYQVSLLSDHDLDNSDLKAFDAIITGVRAYNTRARLGHQQKRLLDYVAAGGTLIVQYNTSEESMIDNLGPYPLKISRERITVEEAPVTFLAPDHFLLNTPNKISAVDFDGWVQERGLYFPNEWDARYQAVISSHDPGESDKRGGVLVARYGRGIYIYTSYAWFRQLPAGVPGAYRFFVNMISAGKR